MNDRRRQQQRERQRLRRRQPPPVGPVDSNNFEFPGVFGWMQRNGQVMVLAGIIVLIGSLGAGYLASQNRTTPPPASTATATATPEGGKPVGSPGVDGVVRRYSGAPPMTIDVKKSYEALIRTEKGDIHIQLLPDKAPGYVNNFVFLARNHFFDGLTFHRVVKGFVAQGGDPLGSGSGGPGYTIPAEKNDIQFDAGIISMASSSAGVSGSQFFITLEPQPALEPSFAAFGRVVEGLEVARALTVRDPQSAGQPPADRILKVEIIEKDR
jgi:peptidylprolyl isomerase